MSNVNTSSALIRDAIILCSNIVEMLSISQTSLLSRYQSAENNWRDSKYQQLGDIVNECNSSLRKTVNELNSCLSSLSKIEEDILEYESVDLSGYSSASGSTTFLPASVNVSSEIVGFHRSPIKNKEDGLRRELEVWYELSSIYSESDGYDIISEAPLRDVNGARVRDPLTNEGRRIDFVIDKDGIIIDLVEVTSLTADKTEQMDKETRIRRSGGQYVRIRDGRLIRLPDDLQTRIIRRD